MELFTRIVRSLSMAFGLFAAALTAAAVVIVCQMVFVRYVLNETTIWQTDFVTYSLVAATFLGSPYVLMTKGHVNVDVLPIYSGPRVRWWLAFFAVSISLIFVAVMAWLTFSFWLESYETLALGFDVARAVFGLPYSRPCPLALASCRCNTSSTSSIF